jgi:hypothetical protein
MNTTFANQIDAGTIGKPKRELRIEPEREPVPQVIPLPQVEPAKVPTHSNLLVEFSRKANLFL